LVPWPVVRSRVYVAVRRAPLVSPLPSSNSRSARPPWPCPRPREFWPPPTCPAPTQAPSRPLGHFPTRRHPSSLALVRRSFSELSEDRRLSPCPRAHSAVTVGASSCLSPRRVLPWCPQLETRLNLLSPSLVPSARAHRSFPRAVEKSPPLTQASAMSMPPFKGPRAVSQGNSPTHAPNFPFPTLLLAGVG
jgi:hypothetical protein